VSEYVEEQGMVILSGPVRTRGAAGRALQTIGFKLVPESLQREMGSWGLPSYADPIKAHEAEMPNSGHTPGTPHPSELEFVDGKHEHACEHVGEDYVPDPRVAFLAASGTDPDRARIAAEPYGYEVRVIRVPSKRRVTPPRVLTPARRPS
jgi:hypothetical protein